MTDKLMHDSDEMRTKGANNGAASAAPYQRAEGDPDWENDIDDMFGNAAYHFNLGTKKYMKDSGAGYTKVGDMRIGMENQSYSSSAALDHGDIEAGASVRRAGPQD
ncbi:hypothetical protein [Nocardia amamiensis]|uniref:hypothetical protein n=1 Tax=Nocardia amamiensis TaxID=404578 RepID=UPI000A91600E|nr:hypothetical protein [Nocardia amamiensis]